MNLLTKLISSPTKNPTRSRLDLVALEDRQLLSGMGRISAVTDYWGYRDLYAIDATSRTVVDYRNNQPVNLYQYGPPGPHDVTEVSAGVDASGHSQVYALDSNGALW